MNGIDILRCAVMTLGLSIASAARAHDVVSHGCQAPARPAQDVEPVEWNGFVDRVDDYRACMNAFIAANHAQSDVHRSAANVATDEWNAFVRGSLNVPEDYPFPPR